MSSYVVVERARSSKARAALVAVLGLTLGISAQAIVPMAPAQAAAPSAFSAKVNFGPGASAAPSGYTQDTGAAFSDAIGRGWVRQDSLDTSTHVPLDLPLNTRDRGAASPSCTTGTPQGRSFIHMQAPVTNATNSDVKGAWEQAVPNGQYKVEVGYGDASLGADAESHTLNVEGVALVKNDPGSFAQNCTASRMRSATGWATVTDGKLTLDAVGGTNTKLAYVTIDSVPVAGLTATAGTASIGLDWDDVDGATYKVWRTEALPVPSSGQGNLVQLGGTLTESAFADSTAEPGVRYHYAVGIGSTPAPVNGAVVQAMIDTATPTMPTRPLKIDFQDRSGATAAGYTADFGRAYSNNRGFGWVEPGTQTPLSIVGNGRTRTAGTAPATAAVLQSSMMHVQYNATGYNQTNGVQRQGAWQAAVPNGRYDVELTVGDRDPGNDATRHVVHVEGTDAVDYQTVNAAGVALAGAARFKTVTVRAVRVTDGFLTIDAIGGTNTKLTDLTISDNNDDLAPDPVTGLVATPRDGSVELDWADNTETDLASYRVYRGLSPPVALTEANLLNQAPITSSAFTDTTAANGTTYYYVVVAVDSAGQPSTASAPVSATPDAATATRLPVPFRVNFVDAATDVAPGFTKDSGRAFTNQRGYGWVTPAGAPLDLSLNSRFRAERTGVSVDVRQRGLMHLQADDITGSFSGAKAEGVWEAAVPNGRYRVTVSAGDQPGAGGVYDSVHSLNVENTPAITRFQATASEEFRTATVVTEVTDGRLTVDATGGSNTKINFVDVAVAAPAMPTALTAIASDTNVGLSWTASSSADVNSYRVFRSTDATVPTTGEPLAVVPAPATSYPDLAVENGTTYTYVVLAVAGDEVSGPSNTVSATPVDDVAPAAPVDVNAAPGDGAVTLSWSGGQASDIETFRVYRSAEPEVAPTSANLIATQPLDAPTYVDDDVVNGSTYYYVITAVDEADNESEASTEVSAMPSVEVDTLAPNAPLGTTATAGDARVTVTWSDVAADDLRGYRVYRSATAGEPGTVISGPTPVGSSPYVDTTALNNTTYYYTVTAVDTTGNESTRSTEAVATPRDTTPPDAPTGVTASGGVNAVTVTWDPAPTGSDVRFFRVYRATSATASFPRDYDQFGTFDAQSRPSYTGANVAVGTTYYYVVTALDAARNESGPSAAVNATPLPTPDTTAPSAPTALSAIVDGDDVILTWTASTSSDVAGYEVYRAASAGATPMKISTSDLRATTYTDSDRPAGSTGYYTVVALDTSNNQSAPSNTVQGTIAQAAVDLAYVFQTDTAAVPPGYTKDIGAAYSAATGRGWVTQASLATSTHTPLNLSANTRLRTRTGVTDLQNRMIHLQYGDIVPTPTTNGSLTPGAWEHDLPNGRYTVTASVGDQPGAAKTGCAAPCYDSTHLIRAEGVTVVPAFQATATNEYKTASATVDVADGRLTIDAIGGNNTKLNWVTIVSAGPIAPDTTAPAAPTGLLVSPGDRSATLSWTAPADRDVAGYDVFRSASATVEPGPATKVNVSGLVTDTSFADTGLSNGTRYSYVVRAVDTAGNIGPVSALAIVTPAAGAAEVSIKVDFSDAATATPASGYLLDYGQGFGVRTGANQGTDLAYGWVSPDTTTPVSLVGNGRDRRTTNPPAIESDARRATMMHMQYVGTAAGSVSRPGSWEVAVPNGIYTVKVDVGDAGGAVDSSHWVNVENQNAIAAFTPTATNKYATATRTVAVTDGRITLSPVGGTNTKITYVDIASVAQNGRPYATTILPLNGTTDVVTNVSPTASNQLPGGAVDPASVANGVTLTRVFDGARVAGVGATSGGADTVSFRPAEGETLLPSTLYRLDILSSVKDVAGNSFLPFSSVFTTKADSTNPGSSSAAFDKTDSGATPGGAYTSLTFGPDGKLYAGSIFGQIYRWTVRADGTLTDETVINTVRQHATTAGWEGAPNRTIIGLTFDPASTADNPVLWITDNYAYLGSDVPNGTGAIARLSGPNLSRYEEVVVNLPRSIKDHETNSIAFHDGKMYITQGSINAMGAQDGTWKKPENLLSAAVLELDPSKLPASLPLDVSTPDLIKAPGNPRAHAGTYNPYAPGAPLTLYATGVRNAFDLVWHSNGNLYTGTNGSAAGGNTPAVPNPLPASCANRPDGGYTGPSAPALTNNRQDETDYVFNIKKGKYYGHPNPLRCEYILNAGNPTGYTGNPLFKVNAYPAGQQADPNYDLANVYDAGLHASANGTVEYQNAGAFGGALKGKLIIVRYSSNQELVTFDVRANGSLSPATTGIRGFTGLAQPLDLVEDPSNGNLYVSELTNNFGNTAIKLLKPQGGSNTVGRPEVAARTVFTEVAGGAASAAKSVVLRNVGAGPLTVTAASITGPDAGLFARNLTLPVTIPGNSSVSVPVTFNPTVAGPRGAVLTFTTDSPTTPSISTALRGLGTKGLGGSNEPSLQWILDTLQIPVDVGDDDPTNNDMPVTSDLIGDEIKVESFTDDPFDNIVKFEPISLFGPAGDNGNVVTVNVHDSQDASSTVLVGRGPNNQNQLVLPTFTGQEVRTLPDEFGFDFTWHGLPDAGKDRITYQEDALNTWSATNPHKVRVYPLKNTDGSVEPYAYIVAPEDVPTGVDFQDAVFIVRGVQPVAVAGGGNATADHAELIYTAVKNATSPEQTVKVTNTGTTALAISSVVLTGPQAEEFTLSGGGPATLAVDASATYTVAFKPGSTLGTRSAVLRISSDDADTPALDVGLYGLALNGLEGGNEPPLADVVRTLGRNINVGWSGLTNDNPATGTQLEGDEVRAPLFTRAAAGPVTMKPVARFSPDEQLPFGWYLPTGSTPERNEVATIAAGQFQTLNPAIVRGGADSFDPAGATFGFYVDSRSFGRSSYTQDALNTGVAHAVRTYPAKDRAGVAIPNTYLVTFEDASNGDYQDYVFEVSNVKVAGSTGGVTPVARIDFGPAASTVATGYTRDGGAPFVTGGSGWVNQATGAPQSMAALTRDRAGANLNLSTLVLMQPTAAQSAAGAGAWRYTLPNGTYSVTVGVGDPDFDDSVHRINVEGQTVVAGYVPTASARSTTGTAVVEVTDGVLDVDAAGGTNTKLQYIDIGRPLTGTDTTPPEVRATLSGRQQSAGSYKGSATVNVTASDPESSVSVIAISVDNGPFQTYTAPVKVSGLGDHTVRARAQNGAGLFTTTATQAFSVVADGVSRGNVVLSNADGVPFPDRLVMNRIQTPASDPVPANVVHDVSTLRVSNNGTEGLNVTALDITGPFALVDGGPSLPALVAPGSSLDVRVRFTATTIGESAGLYNGTLNVVTDDADEPTLPVELAGFWQSVSEGGQEPNLIELAQLFGYTTQIVTPGQPLNQNGLLKANGEEILSPYWLRANAGSPVSVRQLAAFHTQGSTATFFWHAKGSDTTSGVVRHRGVEGQSILPHKDDATNTPAAGTFNPTGAFGFKIDSEWSDPTKNNNAVDRTNGCAADAQCGHHLRIWPARNRGGGIIANTYLVAMDYSGINYDYNDNVYLVSNIKPETAPDPSTAGPIPGAPGLDLGFDASVDGTLADADGQGTGFRSTQPNKRDVGAGSNSYDPSLLDLVTTDGGTLRVTSRGTADEGTNANADNTLVNGLRLPFDGSGEPFSVVARTVGPITGIDKGSEQVGIQLGADQDDYVKVAVISKTINGRIGPAIEFFAEQAGVGATVGTAVAIPSPGAVTGVDLALLADPATRTVRAAYRTGDGAWTVLPTAFVAPASFAGKLFDVRSQAGILVSHKGGDQLVGVFDSFAVRAGDVTSATQPAREALLRIDTGSSTPFTDGEGRVWAPDTGLFSPASAPAEGNRTDAIAGTTDDALYATYRGNTGSVTPRTITYALPTKAATSVDLRLHFAERAAGNANVGRRLFDIDVEGRTVRSDFDIFRAAGALDTATVLRVNNVAVRGGVLDLALRASVDYPAISAIEVLCQGPCPVDTTAPAAPGGVRATGAQAGITVAWDPATDVDVAGYRVYRSAAADGPFVEVTSTPIDRRTFVDTTAAANTVSYYRVVAVDTSDNASQPSEVVSAIRPVPVQNPVRINTGGPAQTVGGVTWDACTSLTACSGRVSGGFPYSENDTITGLPARTNNTIFQSEWTGGATGAGVVPVGQRAFGFSVPVLNGPYTVRLYFAELNKNAANQRTFDVRVEGATKASELDIWAETGGIDRALVKQYPALVTDGVMSIDFTRRIENAKVSAIEILPGADTTAPAAPASLSATGSSAGVALSWPASVSDDTAGYQVYRSASADGTFVKLNDALLTERSYSDTSAPAGVRSYYRVRTVDTAANDSTPVSADAVRPVAAPSRVTGLTATGSQSGIALSWTASDAAGLTGYRVYRSSSASGTYALVSQGLVSGTTYDDPTAPAGARSFYQVTAVNPAGESPRSATADAIRPVPAPAQVTGLTATGSQSGIALSWTASDAAGLTGYRVYRSSSASGTYTLVSQGLVSGTRYDDTSAPAGARSFYQVTAVNSSGESPRSATADALRPAPVPAPSRVTGLTATGSQSGIALSWTASDAAGLTGYQVYRSGSASGTFTRVNDALVTGTTFSDTSAPAGARSFYQVTAVNPSGESPRSATADAARPGGTQPVIRINAGGPAQTVGSTTWSACSSVNACSGWVSGGFTHSENDTISGVPGRLNNTIFQSEWTGGALGAGQVPVGQRAFGFSVPVLNGSYQVRLHFAELNKNRAGDRRFDVRLESSMVLSNFDIYQQAGGIDRAIVRQFEASVSDGVMSIDFIRRVENAKISAIEIIPTDTVAPATVGGVAANGTPTSNTVTWSAGADDDLVGYNVYRSSSVNGPWGKLTSAPTTALLYVDTAAPAGATSYYQVTAVDASGNESARSATVSATRTRPTIRINTGGPAQTVGSTTWSACSSVNDCSGWVSGGFAYSENDTISGVPGELNNTIFRSEWTGGALGAGQVPVGQRAFGFTVPVPNGAYRVRLHFAELNKNGANQRRFDVRLENNTVLSNFDIWQQAGGIDRAIVRNFDATVTDGAMSIDFIRRVENAKISAIEIIPVS